MDERTRALVRLSAALTHGDALPEVMDAAAAADPEAAEEALLQSYLFLGFPAAINALSLWRRRTGRPAPPPSDDPADGGAARGVQVCSAVYADQYDALRQAMESIHPDLGRWAVSEGYGKVLGRPDLDLETRELCIAALLAGLDASRQLHSHLRGCLNVGASPDRVAAMLDAIAAVLPRERVDVARRVWDRVLGRWNAAKGD